MVSVGEGGVSTVSVRRRKGIIFDRMSVRTRTRRTREDAAMELRTLRAELDEVCRYLLFLLAVRYRSTYSACRRRSLIGRPRSQIAPGKFVDYTR